MAGNRVMSPWWMLSILTIVLFGRQPRAQTHQELLQARWRVQYQLIADEIDVRRTETKWSWVPAVAASNPDSVQDLIWPSDSGPVDVLVRRTEALLNYIKAMPTAPPMTDLETQLSTLKQQAQASPADTTLFYQLCGVRRRIALRNPLVDFDSVVFCGYQGNWSFHGGHWIATRATSPQAGLYMVSGFKDDNVDVADMLETTTVTNGPYAGKRLSNSNAEWDGKAQFHSPALSYDGRELLFSWAEGKRTPFHIYRMGVDGSNLRQLTLDKDFPPYDGAGHPSKEPLFSLENDYDPCWLPEALDRIVFASDRMGRVARCGTAFIVGNLWSMKTDGTDMYPISWHETSERYPVVDNDGMVVYSRWDYVDRNIFAAHNLWRCFPDGSDPRAPHGNYSTDDKPFHPMSETGIRPIPGTHGKYLAVEAGHHFSHRGNAVLIDINRRAKHEEQIRLFWQGLKQHKDGLPIDTTWAPEDKRRRQMRRSPTTVHYRHYTNPTKLLYEDVQAGPLAQYCAVFNSEWSGPGNGCAPNYQMDRSSVGRQGALRSDLLNYLKPSHHNVQLTDEEFHRVTLWLDCNSQGLGDYDSSSVAIQTQIDGEIWWPKWDGYGVDSTNPTGVQLDGLPRGTVGAVLDGGRTIGAATLDNVSARWASNGLVLTGVPAGPAIIRVYGLDGRVHYRKLIDGLSQTTTLYARDMRLARGFYVVEVSLRGGAHVRLPVLHARQ